MTDEIHIDEDSTEVPDAVVPASTVTVTTPDVTPTVTPAPVEPVTTVADNGTILRLKIVINKLEQEIESLGGIRTLFHAFSIKDKLSALIQEAKSIF